ncbi:MAG: DegT/DnrJ/EryC1/StrS family aminotransferase, partial [Candidatus Omnitrophota bacterium]
AQAFGAEYKGKKAGTLGDLGAFSFFPSKNLGGCGDGGAVVTNHQELAEFVEVLRNHGQRKKYNADFIGYNSRLDSMQAAILSVKLKHIDKFNDLRRKAADKYNNSFKDIMGIQVPMLKVDSRKPIAACKHVYHLYTLGVSSKRDEFLEYLNSKGIMARIYYPVLLHKMEAFKNCRIEGTLENAQEVLQEVVTLPLHPFLTELEVEYVVRNVIEFFK